MWTIALWYSRCELAVPLEWFPTLRDATDTQRGNWRLIGGGEGIHWEDLDEDILVESLIRLLINEHKELLKRKWDEYINNI